MVNHPSEQIPESVSGIQSLHEQQSNGGPRPWLAFLAALLLSVGGWYGCIAGISRIAARSTVPGENEIPILSLAMLASPLLICLVTTIVGIRRNWRGRAIILSGIGTLLPYVFMALRMKQSTGLNAWLQRHWGI